MTLAPGSPNGGAEASAPLAAAGRPVVRADLHLEPALRRRLKQIGQADLVVGIPSLDNARTIPHVARAVQAGLAKYFPGSRAVLVNADGGSIDGTPDAFREATLADPHLLLVPHQVSPVERLTTRYAGIPGKGSALRTVFRVAAELQAKACAVVDADLRSIEPGWMDLLLGPVLAGFDFVAPLYRRHKFDGTLTNHFVYPLTRSLYGLRVRQPIGGDFGLSASLVRHYLEQDVWDTDVARFGIDAWMTTLAITGGFRVCQAFLGAKIHDPKDPGLDLAHMVVQVAASVFDLMARTAPGWQGVRLSAPVPLFGMERAVGLEPVPVDPDRMVRHFRVGRAELGHLWAGILRPEVAGSVGRLETGDPVRFRLQADLWTRAVHDFALAYRRRALDRKHLLLAFVPLFQGRVASFMREAWDASQEEVELLVEQGCLCFENLKPELLEAWEASGR